MMAAGLSYSTGKGFKPDELVSATPPEPLIIPPQRPLISMVRIPGSEARCWEKWVAGRRCSNQQRLVKSHCKPDFPVSLG
jgi:hypothetical protein